MNLPRAVHTAALLLASAGLSAGLLAQRPAEPPRARSPGMGALCVWSMVAAMADVGRRCGTADQGFQHALEAGEAELDGYAMANGPLTADEAARFKQRHALVGGPREAACSGDPRTMYDQLRNGGGDALRRAVRDVIARPGKLEWGDCL